MSDETKEAVSGEAGAVLDAAESGPVETTETSPEPKVIPDRKKSVSMSVMYMDPGPWAKPYRLQLSGKTPTLYDTEDELLEAVRSALAD